MSSALPLLVFGQVYFLSNSTLTVNNQGPAPVPGIEFALPVVHELTAPVGPPPLIQNQDYGITPPPVEYGTTMTPHSSPEPSMVKEVLPNYLIAPIPVTVHEGYTYTPGIGSHKVHSKAARWNQAREICNEEGGDLAVINSEEEAKVLVRLVAAAKPYFGAAYDRFTLLGFNDVDVKDEWRTVDGKIISEAGYDDWAAGEPNSDSNVIPERCGAMYDNGKLNDVPCNFRYGFVCELTNEVASGLQGRYF